MICLVFVFGVSAIYNASTCIVAGVQFPIISFAFGPIVMPLATIYTSTYLKHDIVHVIKKTDRFCLGLEYSTL